VPITTALATLVADPAPAVSTPKPLPPLDPRPACARR
jgi:hypothetical protein